MSLSLQESYEVLDECIVNEWGAEDDSANVSDAKRWYRKFITGIKDTKEDDIKTIDEKISILKKCVKNMEDSKDDKGEAIKYSLKQIIPFNAIVRLVKRHDYAVLADVLAIPILPRLLLYPSMMQAQIDMTNKAIEYLEDKKEELKKL